MYRRDGLKRTAFRVSHVALTVVCFDLFIFFMATCCVSGDEVVKKNKEGIGYYTEEKYEEALGAYRDAQLEVPESPELHFNIGNTLYQQKKYEEAQEEYLQALSTDDALLQSQIFYNIGNCQYRLNKLVEAVDSYKKDLEINPDDMDAKHNLEFVRNKLKEMAQQQQQQAQQEQQQNMQEQDQEQQQQQGEQAQEQQQAGEEQQAQQQEGEEQPEEGSEEQQQQQAQKAEGEMTEEEAQRILDALKDDEQEVQKEIRKAQSSGKKQVAKDW
jgi:Ca-activated chloride channel family protein